jgi:IS5 family transposase
MIRMLVVGYVFAIRSERLICREVQVNLAYRWFCKLGIEDAIPDHSAFSRARNERFREGDVFRHMFERVVEACIAAGLVGGDGFAVDASLIQADANKRRSIAAQDWRKDRDPQRSSRAVKEYLPRRYGVGRRQRRCAEVRLPIRSRGAPELTRNRHSSRTPTIISST